ncbi:UDP-N-acetylmuramoyl-tripeptide--D-alanyl-D-alanine ligase [Histophilus somni]|uniref:UDP-N-acetylmuramoyl-tripeptide--D-alanyl-D-alanine ligase n=1 Tax=Histophilus somni TaxID=731 RepID=A0A9Q6YZS7_HISSO|nr:UDP-N-acetylmuramoyl-tripeptide--D-alanyl-D-alanine ligase [Histophilus somni]ARU65415.1 UDP-N-acetylmuramoyl-tripeptide--D-alanyl-D-alanine ligase [Histophilus somni]ARU67282.1 UDP-N-acetylmuramoyl-tripeptide--D-alanyl-D-alanine ligase [Histophilus somni]ARU69159.1 UDP-N-acetylmuramoyl-tripeptide--D-alanyl-D-alanine ligase [Histophilus somni]ARU71038.1 UDP-N-acetylmuramoyl-tripeptide--D-alanyl-D-alanine ligase [Histophilus somni]ARU72909.1 UDP-N-acetylmuramoyl-tripeptide--D-alanyl-D-alanin
MIKLSTKELADIFSARLIGAEDICVEKVSTDTRKPCLRSLFFALKGENFDAHDYLTQAVEQGCSAVVVERECDVDVPQLIVPDTRLALGQLAKWLRVKINPKTIAITGSSGKTTVKEMTASILQKVAQDPDAVLFTQGNFNNDIGVPLTLLRLESKHKFAVIELGANHQGEIAYTVDLVQPDVALVNNVAAAHLEGFGSVEGVAQAKGEIYQGLSENGIAIMEYEHSVRYQKKYWYEQIGNADTRLFSVMGKVSDYYAQEIKLTETGSQFTLCCIREGEIKINLPYLGLHNVSNAVAAASLASCLGVSLEQIKAGLEKKSYVKGRLFPIEPCPNLLLLDDTYNANVSSLKSAIDVLRQYDKFFRIFAVGDMAELGENSVSCHKQVADFAQMANLDLVVSFGTQSAVISDACDGVHFSDKTELVNYIIPIIQQKLAGQKVVLLVKGARCMQMEDVINLVKDKFQC